jgi:hypothetical protein
LWDAGSSTQWRQQEQCQKTGIADSILFSKYIHYVRIDSAVEVLEKSMLQCLTAKWDRDRPDPRGSRSSGMKRRSMRKRVQVSGGSTAVNELT